MKLIELKDDNDELIILDATTVVSAHKSLRRGNSVVHYVKDGWHDGIYVNNTVAEVKEILQEALNGEG